MKHDAIYYRFSSDDQTFAMQERAIADWIEALPAAKKPKNLKVYKDEGISGKTTNRPGFQEMLKDAFAGKIETIIVYKLDRFSRNANDAIKLLLDLDSAGVAFISATQPVLCLGHDNPFRRTMLAAFAEIAEIERETIVARVRAGMKAAKARGVKLGNQKTVPQE